MTITGKEACALGAELYGQILEVVSGSRKPGKLSVELLTKASQALRELGPVLEALEADKARINHLEDYAHISLPGTAPGSSGVALRVLIDNSIEAVRA